MVLVFTDTLLYIFSKHITNKIVSCNDKDAPWIIPEVKSAIRRNSIGNGSSVEEFPLTMIKFVKFRTHQTRLYVKLNVPSTNYN